MKDIQFREIETRRGHGITYRCGCDCVPVAMPGDDGTPGFEHCCCGKVHLVGVGAKAALEAYLEDRRQARPDTEPSYVTGATSVRLGGRSTEVAWAFPSE